MKYQRLRPYLNILIILALLGTGYYYRAEALLVWEKFQNKLQPCQRPITYSIVGLDSRFGLSRVELLKDIVKAEKIWEAPIAKQLFEYSPTGNIKINLIYDYRQQATDAMKKIGIVINDDRSSYNTLRDKYDSLLNSYNKQKKQVDVLVATYNEDKSVYEKEVNYWNSRGGAPQDQYAILEQKRAGLNNEVTAINQANDSLNAQVATIKSAEVILNKLVATLNLQVGTYNTVGSAVGKQFNEGEYITDRNTTTINIYQFNDSNQLVRVMAHELGHALGLEHLDNPQAIMYYLNEGGNEKLTADDIAALKKVCGIK